MNGGWEGQDREWEREDGQNRREGACVFDREMKKCRVGQRGAGIEWVGRGDGGDDGDGGRTVRSEEERRENEMGRWMGVESTGSIFNARKSSISTAIIRPPPANISERSEVTYYKDLVK